MHRGRKTVRCGYGPGSGDQMHGIRDNLERNAKTQGLSAEEYLKRGGETMESWEKQAKKVAEENVKASLCLQNLALAEKVTVDDKLVEAKIAELRDVYRKSPDALKNLKDPAVKQDIKNRLIIEATVEKLAKANK